MNTYETIFLFILASGAALWFGLWQDSAQAGMFMWLLLALIIYLFIEKGQPND